MAVHRHIFALALVGICCSSVSGDDLSEVNAAADRMHSNGKTALMVAAKNGDNERINALIERGAKVDEANRNGGTAIMYAALSGSVDTVSLLIEHRADVNSAARNGWTALMIASAKDYADIAKLLLERGATPDHVDVYSWTPLMRAAYEGHLRTTKLLLEHGVTTLNRRGENGMTALHLAVLKEKTDIAKLLLSEGADPEIVDNLGRAALDIAKENKGLELQKLMKTGVTD
jgi:ankyrin repeat protein